MANNEEVLRAFVVSLGWKSEAEQQKQFVGAIESATLKARSGSKSERMVPTSTDRSRRIADIASHPWTGQLGR
jgi:hypothetical protein